MNQFDDLDNPLGTFGAPFVVDAVIDGNDIGFLLSRWGTAGEAEAADLDGDGIVGPDDLNLAIGFWGVCNP